jgi:type VI secretion system protein VasG
MMENHRIQLNYDEAIVEAVAARCTEVESGARNVDNILTNTMLPDMSRQLLGAMAEGRRVSSVEVGIGANGNFTYSSSS